MEQKIIFYLKNGGLPVFARILPQNCHTFDNATNLEKQKSGNIFFSEISTQIQRKMNIQMIWIFILFAKVNFGTGDRRRIFWPFAPSEADFKCSKFTIGAKRKPTVSQNMVNYHIFA